MKLKNLILIIIICVIPACSEDLLDEYPPHLITAETLYTNYSGFDAGVNGVYMMIRNQMSGSNDFNRATTMVGVDNMVTNYPHNQFEYIAERWGDINNPSHTLYRGLFELYYRTINAANTVIDRAEQEGRKVDWSGGNGSPEENKNLIIADAKAVRAFCYRDLVYGWGDVPLVIKESRDFTAIRTDWERTSADEIKDVIIADLEFAEQHIPVERSYHGRMTKGAIQTLLADMNLLIKDYERALYWADKAIKTPEYQLITERYGVKKNQPGVPFMDMFYEGNINRAEGNTEALWVWQFEYQVLGGNRNCLGFFHAGRYHDINPGGVKALQMTVDRAGYGVARMSMTKWALELYEPQDDRGSEYAIRKYFILKDASQNAPFPADKLPPGYAYGDTIFLSSSEEITFEKRFRKDWPYSRKADAGINALDLGGSARYNDFIYIRLGETYLNKAEAQFYLNDFKGAAETINVLRRRANASEISASDITLDFILEERSRELILEEDRRWTLLRNNKWIERTRKYNHNGGQNITERDKLFPIPQSVIDANLTLPMEQNPGY